jgi:NADPH2:quinone reductase
VATTVGSTGKAAFVGALGAEEIIPYRERDFIEAVNAWTDGRGVDVAFDTVGGATLQRTMEAVAHYGDVVTLLGAPEDMDWGEARNRNLRVGFELMLTPMIRDLPAARAHQGEILDRAGEAFDAGELQIHVGETLPLDQAVDAHRHIEAGHTQGKLVLTM